jgi:hypothetical protein
MPNTNISSIKGKIGFVPTDPPHAGLVLKSLTTVQYAAATPANGDLFLDTTTNKITARINGATTTVAVASDLASYATTAAVAAGYQPLNAGLTSISALTTTAFGRSLLTQADASATRTTIGAGTSSFDGAFASLSGKPTTLSGYGISDAQQYDADLAAIAALAGTNNIYYRSGANTWSSVTIGSGLSFVGGTLAATGGGGYTNLTSFVDQTAWRLFYSNGSGDVTELSFGASGTYLKSNGAALAPSFEVISGGGDALVSNTLDQFTDVTQTAGQTLAITSSTTLAGGTHSGTNTGDNAVNSLYSGLVSNAAHTGDATGSTALTVVRINGTSLAALSTGLLKNTTGTGVPSIAVAGTDFLSPGGVLGTPSSGTLTNCTGLPVAGITASTSTALGVGSVELGHASDTTLSRVSAGQIAVEGVNVVTVSSTDTLTNKTLTSPTLTSPVLGTPSSGTLTNCTGYGVASLSGLGTGVATALAVNTGSAGAVLTNGSVLVGTSATLTQTNVNTGVITSTGYSLTGSNASSLIDLAGTWNTSGAPSAIKLNITNTQSNSASNLIDLQVDGATVYKVRKDGLVHVKSSTGSGTAAIVASTEPTTGFGLRAGRLDCVIGGGGPMGIAASYIAIGSTVNLGWGSGPNAHDTVSLDTGLYRNAAGKVEINNGTPGTLRDVVVRAVNTTNYGTADPTGGSDGDVYFKYTP